MTAGRPRDVIYTLGRIESAEAAFLEPLTTTCIRSRTTIQIAFAPQVRARFGSGAGHNFCPLSGTARRLRQGRYMAILLRLVVPHRRNERIHI